MRKVMIVLSIAGLVGLAAVPGAPAGSSGEALFNKHCVMCHPDGGNIINPKKTLKKKDMMANNIRTTEDIIKNMRKPGPGMTTFDAKTISDKDAKLIADHIMKTFK